VEGVLIFGNVQFTTQAARLMLEQGIEMAMFSGRGRLLGQITSPFPKNIVLREAQYERKRDEEFVTGFCVAIVQAKLDNSLSFLREFVHNHPDTPVREQIASLEKLRRTVDSRASLGALRGVEGTAARTYFSAFAHMVRHRFSFEGRKKHPSTDPVNAMLSLGYTMVYNEISWLFDGMGFDPFMGYYHQPHYGHATLASDLLEEFRTPLVDRLVLALVNKRVFGETDFFLHTASGGMYLKTEPRKRYFTEYEVFLTRETAIFGDTETTCFRKLFLRQAKRLKNAILNGEAYIPYKFQW
jgi:CRISP-associated protein Cas1